MCQEIETTHHISRCKSTNTTTRQEHKLEIFEKTLERVSTNPAIIVTFITALTNTNQQEDFPRENTDNTILQAMKAQELIFWKNLELSIIATTWKTTQSQHLKEETDMSDRNIRSQTDKWIITVQECLWKFMPAA